MPAVSVIMPLYNCEDYLPEALESLKSQTCQDFEVILVDDGSTDSTLEIAQAFAKSHPDTQILTQQHSYAGEARNFGMKHAKGEFLLFLDGDDLFDPHLIEKSLNQIRKTGADICVYRAISLNNKTGITKIAYNTCRTDLCPSSDTFNRKSNQKNIFCFTTPCPWGKLFRTSFVRDNNLTFQNTRSANDLRFVMTALAQAEAITVLDDCLVTYRQKNESSLQGTQTKDPLAFYVAYCALQEELEKRHLMEDVSQAFINLAAEFCLYNYETLSADPDSQRKVYELLKSEGFKRFHLLDKPEDFFYVYPKGRQRSFIRMRNSRSFEQFQRTEKLIKTLRPLRAKIKTLLSNS